MSAPDMQEVIARHADMLEAIDRVLNLISLSTDSALEDAIMNLGIAKASWALACNPPLKTKTIEGEKVN